MGTGTENHRGRFQAQGSGLNKKEPWSQDIPLLYTTGKDLLESLRSQLTPSELRDRALGIIECSAAIKNIHNSGGYHVTGKPFGESYPRLKKNTDKRIDLEIKKGIAFI